MDTPRGNLAIFGAGTHVASDGKPYSFSEADIQEIVDSYDPDVSEAPLVVGHPKTDAPAYGWAKALRADNGILFAEPHQVEAQFAGLVNAGRLKKISASIYLRDTPGNPKPGKLYLKHIGFLGAQAPAVKGLPSAQFADGGEAPEFAIPLSNLGWSIRDVFQRLRDWVIERDGAETADRVIPQYQINAIAEVTSRDDDWRTHTAFAEPTATGAEEMSNDTAAQFAERETQLDTRQQELDQREQALREREAAALRADAAEFADGLVESGQLLPRQRNGVVELLLSLPAGTVLNFSQAEGEAAADHGAADVLRELLTNLPVQVDFSEKSGDHARGAAQAPAFAAPGGMNVDAGRMELHSRALDYQRQHPNTPYLAAVKAVGG